MQGGGLYHGIYSKAYCILPYNTNRRKIAAFSAQETSLVLPVSRHMISVVHCIGIHKLLNMSFKTSIAVLPLLLLDLVNTQKIKCPISIDGRIPLNDTSQVFNTATAPFDPNNTKASNLTWSEILLLPDIYGSKFDIPGYKPVEVTINDSSVFVPGGGQPQIGFRRAGLLFGNGTDETNVGIKTFHWSVKQDPHKLMNLSHEYMTVWHEANSFQYNQFSINAGVMLSQDNPKIGNKSSTGLNRNLWKLLDRNNDVIWTAPIEQEDWQNFAVTMDNVEK